MIFLAVQRTVVLLFFRNVARAHVAATAVVAFGDGP